MTACCVPVVVVVGGAGGDRDDAARGVGDEGRPSVGEYGGGESLPGDL